ncbi:unnamed protein product [Brassica oleracea]|uniref:(rape) hypothetical protein n=1 Tax=Brassica napus TaxID=3708 RepID=A0A816JJJ8_BRANA|nr:unnamed protein product [Brassica napus]
MFSFLFLFYKSSGEKKDNDESVDVVKNNDGESVKASSCREKERR